MNLRPYQEMVLKVKNDLQQLLLSGENNCDRIAITRRVLEMLNNDINIRAVGTVNYYENAPPDPENGSTGPYLWYDETYRKADLEINPHLATDEGKQKYRLRFNEYLELAQWYNLWQYQPPNRSENTKDGTVYLSRPNAELVKVAGPHIANELLRWFNSHPMSDAFLNANANAGFILFLDERPDINAIFRLIDSTPRDQVVYHDESIKEKEPSHIQEEIMEIMISIIPIVGSAVGAYEAYTGKNLFGRPLSGIDRCILATTIILPAMARFIMGGEAAYTETRLLQLYKREVAEWQRLISAAGRIDEDTMRIISRAQTALQSEFKLGPALAKEAEDALPKILKPLGRLESVVDKEVINAFEELKRSHPIFEMLDHHAIMRVLNKGPNVDHIKGQLLEELIESRLVPWLLERTGSTALGLELGINLKNSSIPLVFIPGHMIRDEGGRQITDGILGIWHDGELVIVAIFEAKAGARAARELSFTKGSLLNLTKAERSELRAEAIQTHKALKNRAKQAGQKFTKTIEDIEKEILQSQRGGQVQRDIERLYENEDGNPAKIFIGDMPEPVSVRISPTRTKFFLVMPKDAGRITIDRQLTALGYSFEIIGVDMAQRKLREVANKLSPIAQRILDALQ